MRAWAWVVGVWCLIGSSVRAQNVDACTLNEDRCYRAALELREAWDRCTTPRFVVDQTAWSSGNQRIQGVWCEWRGQGGNGVFHSSPVAWPWVAATSSRPGAPSPRREIPRSLLRLLPFLQDKVFADGGPLSGVLQKRLLTAGSRLAGATLLVVEGNRLLVFERYPTGGDVRPEDLPFGLVPWRPVWIFLPELSEGERAVLRDATVTFVVRTTGDDACLRNEISGQRLLSEGPEAQDSTASPESCAGLAEQLIKHESAYAAPLFKRSWSDSSKGEYRGPTVREAMIEALLSPIDDPAFPRPSKPSVDSLEAADKMLKSP